MTRFYDLIAATTCLCLLLAPAVVFAAEKWSRQVEATDPGVADSFDWIPLAQPVDGSSKDRSANARVLTYSQSFPPNGRFGDLPKQQQHQNFDFPYQFQRFPNGAQAQALRGPSLKSAGLPQQEPTSQSFFKFEMPFHGEHNRPGNPSVQTGYQIQHTFGGGAQATVFNSPHFSQQPVFPPEFHPIPQKPLQQHLQQKPLHHQNFIEDNLPGKNSYRESKPQQSQQTLHSVAPQVFPVESQQEQLFELKKPSSFQPQHNFAEAGQSPPSSGNAGNQQEVQLLYVPYDTLFNQQQAQGPSAQNTAYDVNKYNLNPGLPAVNPYQINQFYTEDPQEPSNYYSTSTTSRPHTTSAKPAHIFQSYSNSPQYTTAKPKPKAHQPPLAMFLQRNSARPSQSDVVSSLRHANTIAVIDAPTKQTPEIFVGPAGMPIPDGYVKFDLPYLSQLAQTRDLREVPFFVAPLSYRTPNGFNKILLPEPHVGSIVINRAKESETQQNLVYTAPTVGQRVKQPTQPTNENYPEIQREPSQKHRNPFEVTTQRATLAPARGNKFTYFYDQDAIQEVTSPKITKHDRPKKKRPQNVQIEQPTHTQTYNNPYAHFNQIATDDYYKLPAHKPTTSSSTSTTSTSTTTTSTTAVPPTIFMYNTSPQVEFQSTNGQLYHDFNTAPKAPVEEYIPRFTTRPPPATLADEEYRMKQYFRQQDAFRNRPQPTNPPFEQVHYTPVQLDYDREVTIPATTHRTTTTKQRVTFYTPSVTASPTTEETFNTLPPREQAVDYNRVQEQEDDKPIPSNHRPAYNQNEILDGTVEYEPNPYQLPSELPPLQANLPGLVNDLQDKQNAIEQGTSTTSSTTEQEQTTRPTRRPINRVRKPVVSKITSSVSYSESEATTRRPSHRVRRPFGTRDSTVSSTVASADADTPATTRRTSSGRNPLSRNPNRVRYQPTTEERQTLRLKPRKQYNGSKKVVSASEDLDYQRDVLKQNYPVFKSAGGRRPTSPTALPSSYATSAITENPASETQQVYTVTPSNSIDSDQTFPAGLLEPMQIAQQYNEYTKENYGPGYFPNQEDLSPTEPAIRNEINPVYTTTPHTTPSTTVTTTEEVPATTTRRSPFIRRNYPRLRTTTEAITTTTTAPEERSTLRPRIPPRKVIKVRTRNRRPHHPASSTALPEQEVEQEEPKQNRRKLSRVNQDLYETTAARRRYKTQFQLDGQESQWSPSVKAANNKHFTEDKHNFDNEPEIVTAGPETDENPRNYEINVSANFGSGASETHTTLKEPNLKPEKSFAELLEEVMGKAPEDQATESDLTTRTTDGTYFESQKTTANSRITRRGKWKKLRTAAAHNNESFEVAESQNIGSHLLNSLYNGEHKSTEEIIKELKATTPMTPPTTTSAPDTVQVATTTQTPLETTTLPSEELGSVTTSAAYESESATKRLDEDDLNSGDDLETQPSLFSEVKQQLHELFSIDDNEDDQGVTAALAAVGRRRQDYTSIKRVRPESTEAPASSEVTPPSTEATASEETNKKFHKNLMEQVVYATSTSTKVTSETEICYRGRCIRSEDLPPNHKLN